MRCSTFASSLLFLDLSCPPGFFRIPRLDLTSVFEKLPACLSALVSNLPLSRALSPPARSSARQKAQREFTDVNMPDGGLGCAPLHWAAIANRVDFMRLLLDHGAKVDSRDNAGRTPLLACCAFGAVDAALLLLERNADENAEDSRGKRQKQVSAACS